MVSLSLLCILANFPVRCERGLLPSAHLAPEEGQVLSRRGTAVWEGRLPLLTPAVESEQTSRVRSPRGPSSSTKALVFDFGAKRKSLGLCRCRFCNDDFQNTLFLSQHQRQLALNLKLKHKSMLIFCSFCFATIVY